MAFKPIIQSIFDTDVYKYTMMQFYFFYYPKVMAEFAFKLRTKGIRLADVIPMARLEEQLEYVRYGLKPTTMQLDYMRTKKFPSGRPMFRPEFIEFFSKFELSEYSVKKVDGNYDIRSHGCAMNSSLWETFVMAIISELYFRHLIGNVEKYYEEGRRRLMTKIKAWKRFLELLLIEFGTRRRFSADWQLEVIQTLAKELPGQFLGTSNLHAAMEFGLEPKGTMAHELFMIAAGVMGPSEEGIRSSHRTVLEQWGEMYAPDLMIALSDTFGSDFFFSDFNDELVQAYDGVRHDSEDPFAFGNKTLKFYESKNVAPAGKIIVFSDGVDGSSSIELHKCFHGKIKDIYALGTNLTNDMGLTALSMVMKAVKANNRPLVKLSDNTAKATGDPSEVAKYIDIFKYDKVKHSYTECRY